MQEFEALKTLVNGAETDVGKFLGGNAAAGRRIRKVMQQVKKQCQSVRVRVQEIKKYAQES